MTAARPLAVVADDPTLAALHAEIEAQRELDTVPWSLTITEHEKCADYLRTIGVPAVSMESGAWIEALPQGGTVLLVDRAYRVAGDIVKAGVAFTYSVDTVPPYRWPSEFLEQRAAVSNYDIDSEGMQLLWRCVADRAKLVEVAPTGIDLRKKRKAASPADVLHRWGQEGRLIHVPTGITALDHATRGGPIFGQPWGIQGPPDAAKTAIMLEVAANMAARGLLVGMHAIDEDDDGLLTRFAQRAGVDRFACELREADTLRTIADAVGNLPVLFFGDDYTIDDAAEHLAEEAKRQGRRAALFVDSLQVARCSAENAQGTRYDQVSARVAALRASTRRHRLVCMFTTEQNRASYKGAERDKALSEMGSGKGTGDIEYAAKVLLSMRATDEPDRFELRIVKNKHGRSHGAKEPGLFLQLDRQAQRLTECGAPASAKTETGDTLSQRMDRIRVAFRELGGRAESKSAIYAAAGMKPALALPAFDLMLSKGEITRGGTARERDYRLSVCVQPPHTPYGNGNTFPIGEGNGNAREREREVAGEAGRGETCSTSSESNRPAVPVHPAEPEGEA